MNPNNGNLDVAPKPCAACRHQRKRCDQNCIYWRYFPVEQTEDYMNCYKLFGVRNMTMTLTDAPPHEKYAAAMSMISEAKAWKKYTNGEYTKGGLLGKTRSMVEEVNVARAELNAVHQQLAVFRNMHRDMEMMNNQLKGVSLAVVDASGAGPVGHVEGGDGGGGIPPPVVDEGLGGGFGY